MTCAVRTYPTAGISVSQLLYGDTCNLPLPHKSKQQKHKTEGIMVLFRYGERPIVQSSISPLSQLFYCMQLSSEVCSVVLQSLSRPEGSSKIIMLEIKEDAK